MGKGRRNRDKRNAQATPRTAAPERLPAPVAELTLEFTCFAFGELVNRTVGRPGETINVRLPDQCRKCGALPPFREQQAARILNTDDYPAGVDGLQVQVRKDSPTGPVLRRMEVKDAIYRESGVLFRYHRVYDRERDLYWKRYTNLETGEVEIEGIERLSEHRGCGAARRPKPTGPERGESSEPSPQ